MPAHLPAYWRSSEEAGGLSDDQIDDSTFQHFTDVERGSCDLATGYPCVLDQRQISEIVTLLVRSKGIMKAQSNLASSQMLGVEIHVIDSGVYAGNYPPFWREGAVFRKPTSVRFEPHDDMDNRSIRFHGTKVSALAVGGLALSQLLSTLELKAANLFDQCLQPEDPSCSHK